MTEEVNLGRFPHMLLGVVMKGAIVRGGVKKGGARTIGTYQKGRDDFHHTDKDIGRIL